MPRLWTCLFLFAIGCWTGSTALGQDINNRLISTQLLHAQGLEREWDTHAQVDPNYGRLASGVVHADSTKSHTQYVITAGNRREVIQETDIGPNGQPYGVVGAQEAANLRVEILTAEGLDPQVSEEVLPVITLYLLTDQFVIQAIDAESGATKWATQVGERNWPTSP